VQQAVTRGRYPFCIDARRTVIGACDPTLNGLAGHLGIYAVAPDGTLTRTATIQGLPAYDGFTGMEGIVVT
jgi:hypothetical protein